MYATGLGYRADKVTGMTGSWRDLGEADSGDRSFLLDDYQEAIGMANLVKVQRPACPGSTAGRVSQLDKLTRGGVSRDLWQVVSPVRAQPAAEARGRVVWRVLSAGTTRTGDAVRRGCHPAPRAPSAVRLCGPFLGLGKGQEPDAAGVPGSEWQSNLLEPSTEARRSSCCGLIHQKNERVVRGPARRGAGGAGPGGSAHVTLTAKTAGGRHPAGGDTR
jgi:hypothetical protein